MPNPLDPLGLFDAVERAAQWIASTRQSPTGTPPVESDMPNPLDPLGLFDVVQHEIREIGSTLRSLAEMPASSEAHHLAPAVIGPRERRQAPAGLEYFADSREQLLASANPYRVQMDTAFREAIERVRG